MTDVGIANLFCSRGMYGSEFPQCWSSVSTCEGWTVPPQSTYIYVTDVDYDGDLDDLCSLYGAPSPVSTYYAPYGEIPNNLVMFTLLDCSVPTAVELSSWGRVKALYR